MRMAVIDIGNVRMFVGVQLGSSWLDTNEIASNDDPSFE